MGQGFLPINGANLYYVDEGSGPAVTMVHAGVADHRQWDDQAAALAGAYRVIRFDLRGFGQSEAPAGDARIWEDLRGVLDALGVERTALMGCSMGGAAAIDFTVTYPERVGALITVGSGLSGSEHDVPPEQMAVFEEGEAAQKAGDEQRLNELEERIWQVGFARTPEQVSSEARRRFRAMNDNNNRRFFAGEGHDINWLSLDPPAAGRLGGLNIPTLVIVGSGDVASVVATADDIATGIPGARKAVMPNLGHLPNLDEPEAFNRMIQEFLSAVWHG